MISQEKTGVKTRLKLQGGIMLAAILLWVVDLFFWRLPKLIPYRRSKPQGRMVFKVRD
ncbi:MAG: hypothetical protein AB1510_08580 [Bacillota bacterium]